MERENAIAILESRLLIATPGKYTAKVTSVTPFMRENQAINIVNYAAMTPYHLTQAKALGAEEKWQEATNQALSSSQRVGIDFTPSKGEFVNILVDYITVKNSTERALVVVSVTEIKADNSSTRKVSFAEESIAEEAKPAEPALV